MDVTLIARASHFTHAPAMIRAMIDPGPLDRALRSVAASVDGDGVTLDDGQRVDADCIVLATGSVNLAPFRTATADIDELRADNDRRHQALKTAKTMLIIGAGTVGTELVGEIAYAQPDKKVSLVSSDATLFPGNPVKLGRSLQDKPTRMGVEVILGARADTLPGRDTPEGGRVVLSNGKTIEADLVIPAVGSRAPAGSRLTDGCGRQPCPRSSRPDMSRPAATP